MDKKVDVRTVIAVVGTLFGLIGVFLNVDKFRAERPNVHLSLQSAELSSSLEMEQIIASLTDIEERFGQFTGYTILGLRQEAQSIDPSDPNYLQQVDELGEHIQRAAQNFDREIGNWNASDIQYEGGILTWPDSSFVDLTTPRANFFFPEDILERVRANPAGITQDDISFLQQIAYNLYGPDDGGSEGRREIAQRLRKARTPIVDMMDGLDKRVVVRATVENQSRLPTVLLERAFLRVYRDDKTMKDIMLENERPLILNDLSISSVKLSSKPLRALDEDTRNFLSTAMEREYKCILLIIDLHRNPWHASGVLSSNVQITRQGDWIDAMDDVFEGILAEK